jgi:hypothetical protein
VGEDGHHSLGFQVAKCFPHGGGADVKSGGNFLQANTLTGDEVSPENIVTQVVN